MDQEEFVERSARLQEVGQLLEKLPPEIRKEAFAILRGYVCLSSEKDPERFDEQTVSNQSDEISLFTQFDHDKPSDNVRLLAAHFFSEYGSAHFSVDELKALATEAGLTVPERVDKTLASATENSKKLFMSTGRGKFKPTVYGEAYLKSTYSVKKGTKARSVGDGESA